MIAGVLFLAVIVWDLETVPDLAAAAVAFYLEEHRAPLYTRPNDKKSPRLSPRAAQAETWRVRAGAKLLSVCTSFGNMPRRFWDQALSWHNDQSPPCPYGTA